MKDLTTQTGIIVKCSKTAIEFFQNAQSVDFFSALEIPKEFQDIAVEFYDLIMENDHLAALLGCRGNYDIAIQKQKNEKSKLSMSRTLEPSLFLRQRP